MQGNAPDEERLDEHGECAARIHQLEAALQPFAAVMDWLDKLSETDRTISLETFPTIFANGEGAGGSYRFNPQWFIVAKEAMRK